LTVFVYISRRPKVIGRPKKRLPNVVQPSNMSSWKKPLLKKARGRLRLNSIRFLRDRAKIRYQPNPPLPSNLSWKRPPVRAKGRLRLNALRYIRNRIKIRLPLNIVQPSNLSWKRPPVRAKGRIRLNLLRYVRNRAKIRYQPFPPAPSNLSWKRPVLKKARGRPRLNALGFIRARAKIRLQPSPPAPSNLSWKRPPVRARGRPRLNLLRYVRGRDKLLLQPQRAPSNFAFLPLRRRRPRRKLKLVRRSLNPVQAAPVVTAPLVAKSRLKIRLRRRIRLTRATKLNPVQARPQTPIYKLRPKVRLRRRIKLTRATTRNPVQVAPVVTPPLVFAKLRRLKFRRRPRAPRRSLYPIVTSVYLASSTWLSRWMPRRAFRIRRRSLNPVQAAPVATPALVFAPLRRRRPRRRLKLAVRKLNPVQAAPSSPVFKPRLKIKLRRRVKITRAKFNPVQAAPVVTPALVFVKPRRLRFRKRPRAQRRSLYPIVASVYLSSSTWLSRWIPRRPLRVRRRSLNPVQAAPVVTPALVFKPRPKIKIRRRVKLTRAARLNPVQAAPVALVFKPRLKIKIRRRVKFTRAARLNPVQARPASPSWKRPQIKAKGRPRMNAIRFIRRRDQNMFQPMAAPVVPPDVGHHDKPFLAYVGTLMDIL
jgi:hypothetical protein